jgi:hypothetical protein
VKTSEKLLVVPDCGRVYFGGKYLGFFSDCSAYIYSFERIFCQLFSGVYENFKKFVIFELEVKMHKKSEKIIKS